MLHLIIAAKDGSMPALDQLLKHYRPLLLSLAKRELPQVLSGKVAASSIVQQTCVDALKSMQKLRARTEPECRAWLKEILRANIADANRRYVFTEKREISREVPLTSGGSHPLEDQLVCAARSPDEAAIAREEGERLNTALARLPVPVQHIIQARNRDQLSFVEIALSVGKTPDAVRMIWERGVKQLAKELSRDLKK